MAKTKTTVIRNAANKPVAISNGDGLKPSNKLTDNELKTRRLQKYAMTTFGAASRTAADMGGGATTQSTYGNFYSPQLSTDFLEKPQNLRERRAWYRHFANSNEFVGRALDLHTDLPLSKIRLEKPKGTNQDQIDYMYDFFVEMADEIKLTKVLGEISYELNLIGNVYPYAEDHEPYKINPTDEASEDKIREIKEYGKLESQRLYERFKVIDRDPNYKGIKKIVILPPDQVRIKKVPLSDETLIEFMPDPETRKAMLRAQDDDTTQYLMEHGRQRGQGPDIPDKLVDTLKENGTIPLDTDPYTGSHVAHLARKKSQYETLGVSMLERCVNTMLLQDKLRQAQTQIASRHMTPIRIVWAEDLTYSDVDSLREQVDLALVDPDYSIVANYQVNWEEMGSNGRLLDLSTEYEHMENCLFAGLGTTREMLTGEGSYAGNRLTLEIMNTQYTAFRIMLQDYVENNLFKPVAKKKGFIEKDKFGREHLLYPRLSFTRLSIRDNDSYFDQAMQLYNKGSLPIDVIYDMLNVDPDSAGKKLEADLFTVKDSAFNNLLVNLYTAAAGKAVEGYNVMDRLASYLDLQALTPEQLAAAQPGGGMGMDMGGGMPRFASTSTKLTPQRQVALNRLMKIVMDQPESLDKIASLLQERR